MNGEQFSVMQSKPHMKLNVRFWSYFADVTGCRETAIEAEAGSTLGQLHDQVCKQFPKLADARKSTLKVVGVDYQDDDFVLSDRDEVSLFPPVQGG